MNKDLLILKLESLCLKCISTSKLIEIFEVSYPCGKKSKKEVYIENLLNFIESRLPCR